MLDPKPPSQSPSAGRDAGDLDLHEIVNFLWRRWKFIVGITALAALAGMVFLARQTPVYTANAQILLDSHQTKPFGQDQIQFDLSNDQDELLIARRLRRAFFRTPYGLYLFVLSHDLIQKVCNFLGSSSSAPPAGPCLPAHRGVCGFILFHFSFVAGSAIGRTLIDAVSRELRIKGRLRPCYRRSGETSRPTRSL